MKLALRYILVPGLGFYLRFRYRLDAKFQCLARHSVVKFGYNIFFSDLDLTVIISFEDLVHSDAIKDQFGKWKKVLIFLGELEIYTPEEHLRMLQLLELDDGFHAWLRDLRKIGWAEDDLHTYKLDYHQAKAKRFFTRTFKKYQVKHTPKAEGNIQFFSDVVSSYISKFEINTINYDGVVDVFVPYLGFYVKSAGGEVNSNQRQMTLPIKQALIFLALVPFSSPDANLNEIVAQLRNEIEIKKRWLLLLEYESLTIAGVYRARAELFPWMPSWKSTLDQWRFEAH